jgi:tryptophan 6-halogenase
MKIKNIVIVGGGTAGWSAAHQFINKTNFDVKVTLISSKEIPIIGVGESTTGRFNDLINLPNNVSNLNEKEFLKETEATFKLGIKHSDWYKIGESFYSPIGDNYENETRYPSSDYDCFRIFHIAEKLNYDNSFQSQLMKNNKLHFFNVLNEKTNVYDQRTSLPVAYHLDTYKTVQYLKSKAIKVKSKFKYIEDEVIKANQNEKGYVTSVKTKKGKIIKGDLFIDCTGFKRLLIQKLFDNNFVSYKNELMVNRALPFYIENKKNDKIRNYTHAWAQKYGWMWQIPTQKRLGCGYVYNDNYITPEQAKQEVEKVLGQKIIPLNDIKFEAGRLEKIWTKNVISTGLASGFVEPLEATSIHATIIQITHFIENYYKPNMPFECELFENQYNLEMNEMWDKIKDFIVFHYITPRKDTEFWKEASNTKRRSIKLKMLLEKWKYKMPRVIDYISDKNNNFYNLGNSLWYQIAIGMQSLDDKIAKEELVSYGLYDYIKTKHKIITDNVQKALPNLVDTNDFYDNL